MIKVGLCGVGRRVAFRRPAGFFFFPTYTPRRENMLILCKRIKHDT